MTSWIFSFFISRKPFLVFCFHQFAGADRVQASLAYRCLHQTALPYFAEEFRLSTDVEARQRLCSASSSSLVVRCTRLSSFNHRIFSGHHFSTVEHSAAERNVGASTYCFYEDSPFQSFFPQNPCIVPAQ